MPLRQTVAELVLGLGLALAGANLWAFLRPRFGGDASGRPVRGPGDPIRSVGNILLGLAVAAAALWYLLKRI